MNFNESAEFLPNSLKIDRFSNENLTIIIMIKIVSLQLNSILLNRKLPVANHACFRSEEKDVFFSIYEENCRDSAGLRGQTINNK